MQFNTLSLSYYLVYSTMSYVTIILRVLLKLPLKLRLCFQRVGEQKYAWQNTCSGKQGLEIKDGRDYQD